MNCLKKFRTDKKLSREQIANKIGVSLSLYDKIEFEARTPSRNFLNRFKQAFPEFDMNIFFDNNIHDSCNQTYSPLNDCET